MARVMIWLRPDAATHDRLDTAAQYLREVAGDALPAVVPHLTVASGLSEAEPSTALAAAVADVPPVRLRRAGPVYAPDPSEADFGIWRSLYLPLENTSALRALRAACRGAFGLALPQKRQVPPHVSLAYTRRSAPAKAAWLDTLATQVGSVTTSDEPLRFSAIEVRGDVPDDDAAKRIESWQILARAPLSEATPR